MRSRGIQAVLAACLIWGIAGCGGDDGGSKSSVNTKTYAEIDVDPKELVFTPLAAGQSQTLSVTITNSGSGDDLILKEVYIRDEGVPYVLAPPAADRVAMEDSLVLSVTYTSVGDSPGASVLIVKTNARVGPNIEIPLSVGQTQTGLLIYPDPIDFGEVSGGDSKLIRLTIENWATSTTSIVNTFIQPGSSADFTQIATPEYPKVLPPGDKAIIELVYRPTGGGSDTGKLIVVFNEDGVQALKEIPMMGQEVGPELSVSPPMLDFQWVAVNGSKTLELNIHNMGGHKLRVRKITMAEGSNVDVRVDDPPNTVAEIESGKKAVFHVTFAPKTFFATTADPIAGVRIESNDAEVSDLIVPVYGNIDAPFIKVDPADQVDFGIVAQNWTIERPVTITNVGHAPLVISLVDVAVNTPAKEFGVKEEQDFQGTATIAADESIDVLVTFSNNGAAAGTETGKLKIVSNDPITPEVLVNMVALRGGQPECKIGFIPPKLDFGSVAHGSEKTQTMFVKNTGSGYCSWKSGMIKECTSWMGMMTNCMESAGPSSHFHPLGMPIPVMNGMAPGTSHPIQIRYKPPTTIPFIPIFEEYQGVLQVRYAENYSNPGGQFEEHVYPIASSTGTLNWNIRGTSGVADIAVLPPEIDFGLVTIGCYSQTKCVKVYNAGTANLDVFDLYLDGCGPEFIVKTLPELPLSVPPSQFKEVCVVYLPQNEGPDSCGMMIESSDMKKPLVRVPLAGEGTWETEHTDYFTQISGRKVDILFVVDESGSMCGEQSNLATNMGAFTSIAQQWDNDFQIGIVTTNIDADYDKVGKFHGSPRILTNTTVAAFKGNVSALGCNGSGKQESGLEAARRALTPPNITTTDVPCSCANDTACPASCLEGELCVNGKCGGWNRGFLRDDASLEIVFLSDEEDQSPGSVPFYIDYFMSIKGFLNTNLFHAHAIVGPKPSGCSSGGSDSDGADDGARYIAVQEATGGKFGSICSTNYSTILADIGNVAFGLQVQFFLTAQADSSPGSMKVWLDRGTGYQECTTGWNFNQPTNSVVFDQSGTCMPVAGDKIKVWYKMVCFTE
jgi:hypothetical protein